MSNNSEQVERIVGGNPGALPETGRSDAVNSSKMPIRDGRNSKPGSYAGTPLEGPAASDSRNQTEHSGTESDQGEPSRQTAEARDESGQL